MLIGKSPWISETGAQLSLQEIFAKIQKRQFFNIPSGICTELKDFFLMIFKENPAERATAEQLL